MEINRKLAVIFLAIVDYTKNLGHGKLYLPLVVNVLTISLKANPCHGLALHYIRCILCNKSHFSVSHNYVDNLHNLSVMHT